MGRLTPQQKNHREQSHRMLRDVYGLSSTRIDGGLRYDCGCRIPDPSASDGIASYYCERHHRTLGVDDRVVKKHDDEWPHWVLTLPEEM